jgi:hypothetical protein
MTIKISKNYGFVKTFNYYLFPYLLEVYPAEQIEEYTLTGLSAPKAGIQNLTWMDVNDFQAGDELHILEEYSCWNPVGGSAVTTKSIYKYLERTDYSDSVSYKYAFKQSVDRRWTDSSSFNFFDDTVTVIIKPDPLFDKLPGEPIVGDQMYNYSMANGPILSKTNHRGIETFYPGGDGCWQLLVADGCLTEDKYLKGLGGPYYTCEQAFCLGGSERKLVYYKKGEETWGNPIVVSEVSAILPVKNVKIYPNPAGDYITVSFENVKNSNCIINIYDLQGRLQRSEKYVLNNSRINISDLLPGIYILKFVVDDRILRYDKIIVK